MPLDDDSPYRQSMTTRRLMTPEDQQQDRPARPQSTTAFRSTTTRCRAGGCWIFWATIVFAVLYLLNVPGVGIGKGRIADYDATWPPPRRSTRTPRRRAGAESPERSRALTKDATALA